MHKFPLSEEVAAFIHHHRELGPDVAALSARNAGLPHTFIADQIKSLQKIKSKIPEWYDFQGLILPESKFLEQSSSSATAHFKAGILTGYCFADLSGGSGVDTWALSKYFPQGHYLEPNEHLFQLASHNFQQLGMEHIHCHHTDAIEWSGLSPKPDVLYLDPSRRDIQSGKRVAEIENYEPNPLPLVKEALHHGMQVMLKVSPMDSLPGLLAAFDHCSDAYVLALKRECKEIVLVFKPNHETDSCTFHAVELQERGFHLQFTAASLEEIILKTENPLKYIYDLHPALMKLGAYQWPLQIEGVHKLHIHTHLYTSEHLIDPFPGRTFLLRAILNPKANEIQEAVPERKAMVMTRNFPDKPENLLSRWKLKEGGTTYLVACTLKDEKHKVLILDRIH